MFSDDSSYKDERYVMLTLGLERPEACPSVASPPALEPLGHFRGVWGPRPAEDSVEGGPRENKMRHSGIELGPVVLV